MATKIDRTREKSILFCLLTPISYHAMDSGEFLY
ncbi:hypothetical protein NIES298_34700 [Microcystis aeruginosa NIES-298]|nr:hypothetical protein NIES298_34700 [Microcystis aeruginosa NIES-298]